MKLSVKFIIINSLCIFSFSTAFSQQYNQIRNRLKDLKAFEVLENQRKPTWNFQNFLKKVDKSGAFMRADIKPASQDVKSDLLQLALYLEGKLEVYADPTEIKQIKTALYRSFNYWLSHKPTFKWTDSALDQPRYVGAILLILADEMKEDQQDSDYATDIIEIRKFAKEYVRYTWNFGKSSTNFLSLGDDLNEDVQRMGNVGYRMFSYVAIASSIEDKGTMDSISIIAKNQFDIHVNSANSHPISLTGDYSFHQHNYGGSQIYNLGYGLDWFSDFVGYAYYMEKSPWALDSDELSKLVNFLDQGIYPFFLANGQVVEQVLGRHNQLPDFYSSFPESKIKLLRSFFEIGSSERKIIDSILSDPQFDKHSTSKTFYTSDLMLTKNKNYAASVRFISDRTSGQESGDDGQKNGLSNFYFSDGSFLLYKTNKSNAKGAWDWRMIPGATTELLPLPLPYVPYGKGYGSDKSFAGMTEVSNGVLGSFAQDRVSPENSIKAVKSYALLQDLFLFEGHDIQYTGKYKVSTTIAQELASSTVSIAREGKITLMKSMFNLNEKSSTPVGIWQNNIAYIILPRNGAEFHWSSKVERKQTDWKSLDARNTRQEVSESVFTLSLEHGDHGKIDSDSYLYLILPEISEVVFNSLFVENKFDFEKLRLSIIISDDFQLTFKYQGKGYFFNFKNAAVSEFEMKRGNFAVQGLLAGEVEDEDEGVNLQLAQLEKRDNAGMNFQITISSEKKIGTAHTGNLKEKLKTNSSGVGTVIFGNSFPFDPLYFGSTFKITVPITNP